MTQIANLRQIDGTATAWHVAKNGVWRWSIAFPAPAGPQVPLLAPGALAVGSATVSGLPVDTVAGLVTGQPVRGYGVPAGATIAGFPSSTSITLSAAATQAGAAIPVTILPLPLDLTGIGFRMQVRRSMSLSDRDTVLDCSTDNGLLINGGATGVLSAYVTPDRLVRLSQLAAAYVADILARAADGGPINLMALTGPAAVIVIEGVTDAG